MSSSGNPAVNSARTTPVVRLVLAVASLAGGVFPTLSARVLQTVLPSLETGVAAGLVVLALAAAAIVTTLPHVRGVARVRRLDIAVIVVATVAFFQGSVWLFGGLLVAFI